MKDFNNEAGIVVSILCRLLVEQERRRSDFAITRYDLLKLVTPIVTLTSLQSGYTHSTPAALAFDRPDVTITSTWMPWPWQLLVAKLKVFMLAAVSSPIMICPSSNPSLVAKPPNGQ